MKEDKKMIKPVGDRIIIRPVKEEQGTFAMIESKKRPQKGVVVGSGNDCKVVKEGDSVIFHRNAGSEIEYDMEQYILMREENIIGVI